MTSGNNWLVKVNVVACEFLHDDEKVRESRRSRYQACEGVLSQKRRFEASCSTDRVRAYFNLVEDALDVPHGDGRASFGPAFKSQFFKIEALVAG